MTASLHQQLKHMTASTHYNITELQHHHMTARYLDSMAPWQPDNMTVSLHVIIAA
jgi:hypothetical protein